MQTDLLTLVNPVGHIRVLARHNLGVEGIPRFKVSNAEVVKTLKTGDSVEISADRALTHVEPYSSDELSKRDRKKKIHSYLVRPCSYRDIANLSGKLLPSEIVHMAVHELSLTDKSEPLIYDFTAGSLCTVIRRICAGSTVVRGKGISITNHFFSGNTQVSVPVEVFQADEPLKHEWIRQVVPGGLLGVESDVSMDLFGPAKLGVLLRGFKNGYYKIAVALSDNSEIAPVLALAERYLRVSGSLVILTPNHTTAAQIAHTLGWDHRYINVTMRRLILQEYQCPTNIRPIDCVMTQLCISATRVSSTLQLLQNL